MCSPLRLSFQPLYCGSTLVFPPDVDLSAILLYDPCFDFLGAGWIQAVPIHDDLGEWAQQGYQPVIMQGMGMDGDAATQGEDDVAQQQQQLQQQGLYDPASTAGTVFGQMQQQSIAASQSPQKQPSPKKHKHVSPKKAQHASPSKADAAAAATTATASDAAAAAAAAAMTQQPQNTNDGETSSAAVLAAVVVEGVRQMSDESDAANDDDDDDEEDESDAASDEEGGAGEDDDDDAGSDANETEGQTMAIVHLRQPPQLQHYVWTPAAYSYAPGAVASDDSALGQSTDASFYYSATPASAYGYGPAAGQGYEDTSLHADRRRRQQGQFMSHFDRHSNHNRSSYHDGASHNKGGSSSSYSPPLMAQRRDLYFQQDLHLHVSSYDHAYGGAHSGGRYSSRPAASLPSLVYSRQVLLELRSHPSSHEPLASASMPTFLFDIFRAHAGAHAAPKSSRSLFGNNAANGAPQPGRSIFGQSLNHAIDAGDSSDEDDAAADSNPNGVPPKKGGGKLKSKRKKNKDRSARAIEDDLISATPRGGAAAGGAGGSTRGTAGRGRLDSMDHDDTEERKEDGSGGLSSTTKRGLSTPKVKPLKQKKNKTGGKGAAKGESPRKGSSRGGGGGAGHHHGSAAGATPFKLDEFEHATMADLHHAEHAWQPSLATPLALVHAPDDSLLQAEKTTRSILNKLSIDKLETLAESLLCTLVLDSRESLEVVVDTLFDKSVDEPEFCALYARFAAIISARMPEFRVHIGAASSSAAAAATGATSKVYSFRTLLLTRAYKLLMEDEESLRQSLTASALAVARSKEFSLDGGVGSGSGRGSPRMTALNSRTNSPPHTDRSGSPRTHSPRMLSATTSPLIAASATPLELPLVSALELAEKLRLQQVHQRGNLIFIGELFKNNLLAHSVVHLCLDMLLDGTPEADADATAAGSENQDEPSEWDVECVCIFLGNVGAKLDAAAARNAAHPASFDPEDSAAAEAFEAEGVAGLDALRSTRRSLLDAHFRRVSRLSRCATLPSRFRFMLQDLLDLRARHWVPRIQKTVDPKSLVEIREAAQATLQQQSTPAHGTKSYSSAMTSVKKGPGAPSYFGASKFGGAGAAAAAAYPPQHLRTTVKAPARGAAAAPAFQGRALQFGAPSPTMLRSSSAPDRHELQPGALPFSPMPALGATPGKYLPLWKRKALGLEEQAHGLLPRSLSTVAPEGTDDAAASAAEEVHEQQQQSEGSIANPCFGDEDAAAVSDDLPSQSLSAESESASSHPAPSLAELSPQLDVILAELYSSHDLAECVQCLSELASHYSGPAIAAGAAAHEVIQCECVLQCMSKCVEQPLAPSRDLCATLLTSLVSSGWLSRSSVLSGLGEWFALQADVAIDIPHAPLYCNRVLARLVAQRCLRSEALWHLLAQCAVSGAIQWSDAQAWALETLQLLLRESCKEGEPQQQEAALVALLTDEPESASASASEAHPAGAFQSLFAGDAAAAAAREALRARSMDFAAQALLRTPQ